MEVQTKSYRESLKLLANNLFSILRKPLDEDDPINKCGEATLSQLETDPDECFRLAHERLHVFPFKDVPERWRRLYCEASLWKTWRAISDIANQNTGDKEEFDSVYSIALDERLGKIIETLDMCLIMTNAPRRYDIVQELIMRISKLLPSQTQSYATLNGNRSANGAPQRKKRKPDCLDPLPAEFRLSNPDEYPPIHRPIRNIHNISLPEFQSHLIKSNKENLGNGPLPLIITNGASHWPALENNLWRRPSYFLSRTSMGHRLVPIELGRSYTDDGWGQKIVPFKDFMNDYMLNDPKMKGYLAQHDLFAQIPKLKDDICILDYCFSEPPSPIKPSPVNATDGSSYTQEVSNSSKVGDDLDDEMAHNSSPPLLNIWMGSAHTISPAHTDPHHNILVQVVGHKYVRLFAPSESSKMYPLSSSYGVNMSNTSRVDVGHAMRLFEGWDKWTTEEEMPPVERDPIECDDDPESLREDFNIEFPNFTDAAFSEGILGPGDCLYIPKGWWHYVRSLSPSVSVSFWWD
jgi:Cupin-like domain